MTPRISAYLAHERRFEGRTSTGHALASHSSNATLSHSYRLAAVVPSSAGEKHIFYHRTCASSRDKRGARGALANSVFFCFRFVFSFRPVAAGGRWVRRWAGEQRPDTAVWRVVRLRPAKVTQPVFSVLRICERDVEIIKQPHGSRPRAGLLVGS
jgi:hypothetical protein